MSHLSRDELLDVLESESGGHPHLAACASCRQELDALRSALAEARAIQVPEPSPLFWDHFSARVSLALRAEAAAADAPGWGSWWRQVLGGWRLAPVVLGLSLLVGLGIVVGLRYHGTGGAPALRAAAGQPSATLNDALPAEAQGDESWSLLATLASESDASSLEGDAPGTADAAMLQLSESERNELARLIKAEMQRQDARTAG